MLYGSGFRAPDEFLFLQTGDKRTLLLNDLEVDRGRSEATVDEVVSYSEVEAGLRGRKKKSLTISQVVGGFLLARGIKRVEVPADFPLGMARALKKLGVRTKPSRTAFWPSREFKTPAEARKLTEACRVAEAGVQRAYDILAATKIRKDRRLTWGGRTLTSELLRAEIEVAVVRAGGQAAGDSIVAGGEQACDPHGRGSGPLRAGELIILDVFPRHSASKYFGDITRTVVRGSAPEACRKLWETCLQAQQKAFKSLKPGADGAAMQREIQEFFAAEGYPREIYGGRWRGFFHGLGHGLGLEIHESPRIATTTITPGQVVTIEPGIYWPGVGGVRHEDVAFVTSKGYRLLTKLAKPLEI
ncbi:MAG: Xaa-Pro peptidase family protein [Terrimicrobiaceae bacterium]